MGGTPCVFEGRGRSLVIHALRKASGRATQLCDNIANHVAVFHIQALATGNFKAVRIETKLMEHGRVDVGDVMAILNSGETEFVSRAMYNAALDSAASHP